MRLRLRLRLTAMHLHFLVGFSFDSPHCEFRVELRYWAESSSDHICYYCYCCC